MENIQSIGMDEPCELFLNAIVLPPKSKHTGLTARLYSLGNLISKVVQGKT